MAKWYVLQVSAGQETAVRDALHIMGIQAAVPQEKRLLRKNGGWTSRIYTLFPGYVFLSLEYSVENYYRVKAVPHVLRFLGFSGLSPSCLTHLEAEWLRLLSNGGEPLKPSRVEELPDGSVRIMEGVLQNFPVRSIHFDRRARRARVGITLCGEPKILTLSMGSGKDVNF